MLPNVAIISRPAGPRAMSGANGNANGNANTSPGSADLIAARRRTELAAEARRLARRRLIADVVARRTRENDRGLRDDASDRLFHRAKGKAAHLGLMFHRSIELLWEADGFDEALAIFREHKREFARRTSRFAARQD